MKLSRPFSVLFLASALLAAAPETRAQVNAEQVLAIGRNVLSMEDYMLAIQYFNQAIKAKPYLAEPYFFRALAKLNLDDYKGAEADCTAALERNKFKTEAYKLRGFARQQLGLDSLAITDYDKGLEANPYDRYFLYYKGVAQSSLKKYEDADSTFALLLRSHPAFDEGVAARGRLNLLKGDTIAALQDADRAITLNRTLLSPWLLRSQIKADKKEWDEAIKDMDEVLLLRPEEPDFYINRAYLRYNADNFFGAMADYNQALQLRPDYEPALFNRALLRLEVKDLTRSAEDFSAVLRLDPSNFHALYNRGLVYLELGRYRDALADFQGIASRYPRFYPAYYAIAEAYRNLGDLRQTAANINKADRLVSGYVANPSKNPLDRPAIAAGKAGRSDRLAQAGENAEENPEEVMEEFNRLVTVATDEQPELAFNERIKGRVQDRNIAVDPEPVFILSFLQPARNLAVGADSFRELADFNNARYLTEPLYLTQGNSRMEDSDFEWLSRLADDHSARIRGANIRPADHFARGVALLTLRNYPEAIAEFTAVLDVTPDFTLAYLGRAEAKAQQGFAENSLQLQLNALSDLDEVVKRTPGNPYAWYNKAALHYRQHDYAEAAACLDKAIALKPDMGAAYYNRGLCLLQSGRKREAFADLSKAGELGILPSYNLLKRLS